MTEPKVFATLNGVIVGKAVSGHANQPVVVTIRFALPDGGSQDLSLTFPGEADAEGFPAMHDGHGNYTQWIPVRLVIMDGGPEAYTEVYQLVKENAEDSFPVRGDDELAATEAIVGEPIVAEDNA